MATVLLVATNTDGNGNYSVSNAFGNLNTTSGSVVFTFSNGPGSVVLNRCDYLGMAGYPLYYGGQYKGVFGNSWNGSTSTPSTKITDISDGTSNTILFGEYSSGYVDFGTGSILTGECTGTFASGPIYTYWGPDTSGGRGTDFSNPPRTYYQFGSKHTGIFNVSMADGSVQSLSNNINYTVWLYLGAHGRRSGHPRLLTNRYQAPRRRGGNAYANLCVYPSGSSGNHRPDGVWGR